MRLRKTKAIQRLIANNLARLEKCCGLEDFSKLCPDCHKFLVLIDWAVYLLAFRMRKMETSNMFKWIKTQRTKDDWFVFVLQAGNTKEIVRIFIGPKVFKKAQSAINRGKPK